MGEARQHITDPQVIANSKNKLLTASSRAYVSDFPSIIKANDSELAELISFFPSVICWVTFFSDALIIAKPLE